MDDEEGSKPFVDSFVPHTIPRFKFQEKAGEPKDALGKATESPGLTAISTSAGLLVRERTKDAWSFVANGSVDEDRMTELRDKFGMDPRAAPNPCPTWRRGTNRP